MQTVKGYLLSKIMMPVFATLTVAGLILLAATGCTPTMNFYSNGYPLAKEAEFASSPDGKLSARWVLVRVYPKKIERTDYSELIDYPEYLSVDDLNTLRNDTRAVLVHFQVSNPQLQRYRLVKVVKVGGVSHAEALSDWTIRPDNNLVIAGPLVFDKEVTISLSILSGETGWIDSPLISTGDMQYVICDSQSQEPRPEEKEGF